MKVFAIGASRGVGYYASVRLLEKGATVTFLLRSPAVFDNDEVLKSYVQSGHARIVQGDALNPEDVARAWATAQEGPDALDLVLFTLGAAPKFTLKGVAIFPHDICTRALLNIVRTMPLELRPEDVQPKIVIISSSGITQDSHNHLPFLLRIIYPWLLSGPHVDKLGLERVLAHWAGWDWKDKAPRADVLPSNWATVPGTPGEGELKRLLVVRPAMFTDGECKGDKVPSGKAPYRVGEGNLPGNNGYTVSRRDVAHFIVEGALANWEQWGGKGVTIAY